MALPLRTHKFQINLQQQNKNMEISTSNSTTSFNRRQVDVASRASCHSKQN